MFKKTAGDSEGKSPVGHESSQRQERRVYDPARNEDISRRNKTRLELWEEHLKDPIAALDKALKCVASQY